MAHFKNYKIFFHFPIAITEVFQNVLKKALQDKKDIANNQTLLKFCAYKKNYHESFFLKVKFIIFN